MVQAKLDGETNKTKVVDFDKCTTLLLMTCSIEVIYYSIFFKVYYINLKLKTSDYIGPQNNGQI